jgi:uncharacterized repeat protein (TIGR01451 family)
LRRIIANAIMALCIAFFFSAPAKAANYPVTNAGTVDGACLTRNINVTQTGPVSDVNLGVVIDHGRRTQIQVTLTNPSGTARSMISGIGGTLDDLNVFFDDEAASAISTHTSVNDDSTATPYQRTFIPAASLAGFDGQAANGTWVLQVCDSSNDGRILTFVRADLDVTSLPASYADLSLTKTVSNANPANGAAIFYTLAVTNAAASPDAATNVAVRDVLPAGATFVSASGFGSYNSGTGIWTVGSIPAGTTRTLTINVTVNASSGAVITNGAEVSASDFIDSDSTPDNGSTTEDDDAFVSFTVSGTPAAGTPPTLICPVGSVLFDWNTQTWPAGDLNENLTQAGVGIFNITITPDDPLVTGSPAINGNLTGGFTGQTSLFLNMNNNSISDESETVIALPTAVPGLQFRLFDVDFGSGSFADKVTVTGTFNGSPVSATLTNGVSNYVTGNIAIGNASATDTTANGNVVVTFASPVDTVTITYGNHSTAPADPGNQWMSIHDITMCRPQTSLSVTKISNVVSDGVSATNPKAVPTAIVRYCILVSNSGSATATNIAVADAIPATVTYIAGTLSSGSSCASTTTVEDDDAAGADESDPFGVSVTGTTLTGTAASLGPAAAFAIAFNANVN